jgi:predicted outer membrane lipoprotein
MKTLRLFLIFMAVAVIAIVLGVVIGNYGAWYFSWLIGTATIVLFAAAGGVLYDAQENEKT